MQLSIDDQFCYKTVLLTGGLGGVGSVCLEQLLRQTQVQSVVLLVRRRGAHTAYERVRKLLCSPLFHGLHQQVAAGGFNPFPKVRVIDGDLDHPGLGLSESDRQFVLTDVDIILHCAADLALESHIQRTLRSNYCGTRRLLEFAREVPNLRAFVYVSTFYVNNFKPFNSAVKEEVHQLPLQLAGDNKPLTHGQLVELLLSMPPHTAAAEAAALMDGLNFASTYAFGKHLTEHLFSEADSLPGVGKAIVRPSLVCSIAGAPYPGFCSGLTGAPGFMLGYGTGYIHSIKGVAHASDALCDLIPADAVSALIVTAAAAAAASGPGDGTAKVYHATSADSHPCSIRQVYQAAATFWASNPCPFKVPFARYPTYKGHHSPTLNSVQKHQRVTGLKVALAAKLLQLSGKSKQAAALAHGFKTAQVMNTPRMCRSFVSLVDNSRELQASLAPEQADKWCSVWDKDTCMSWDTYLYTTFAGLYAKAFRGPKPDRGLVTPVPHLFIQQQGLPDEAIMEQWMASSLRPAQPKWAVSGREIQLLAQSGLVTAFEQRAADQETSLSQGSTDAMVLVS